MVGRVKFGLFFASKMSLILQVMTDVEDKNEWKNCFDVAGVRLPTGYFFGASAGTGDLSGKGCLPKRWNSLCCLDLL